MSFLVNSSRTINVQRLRKYMTAKKPLETTRRFA